mmetsp:Transcript_45756/g.115175  ORF Transcript_45756/g.115175 Transcript_45756/m.115175 type:complete len:612 (-) Transcript_45756:42-1877(-)
MDHPTKKRKLSKADSVKAATKSVPTGPVARYHCDYCHRDLSETVRIKCAECADFDLCLDCFSVGVELSGHKREHAYQVVDKMHFPIIDRRWGADEELLLLECINSAGLGNWVDIAEQIETKTPEQCEEHYYHYYIDSKTAPFPDLGKEFKGFVDKRDRMRAPPPPTVPPPQPSGPVLPDSGFMPKRLEFETEYFNDAELLLAEMRTNGVDYPPTLQELQVKILQIYNYKLMDRYEKRKFLLDNDVFDAKKAAREERARPKEERDIIASMRPFLQLTDKNDHARFTDGLIKEMRLRQRIAQLQEFRRNGILSLSEGEKYLEDKKRRLQEQQTIRRTREETYSTRAGRVTVIPPKARKHGQPLDITSAPDVHLLSPQEQKLCSAQRVFPQQYLIVKDTLLRENLRVGYLKKRSVRTMLNIDVNKSAKFFDFFEAQGWINTNKEAHTKVKKGSGSNSSGRKSGKRSGGSKSATTVTLPSPSSLAASNALLAANTASSTLLAANTPLSALAPGGAIKGTSMMSSTSSKRGRTKASRLKSTTVRSPRSSVAFPSGTPSNTASSPIPSVGGAGYSNINSSANSTNIGHAKSATVVIPSVAGKTIPESARNAALARQQ